jgi:hypothetical protein
MLWLMTNDCVVQTSIFVLSVRRPLLIGRVMDRKMPTAHIQVERLQANAVETTQIFCRRRAIRCSLSRMNVVL